MTTQQIPMTTPVPDGCKTHHPHPELDQMHTQPIYNGSNCQAMEAKFRKHSPNSTLVGVRITVPWTGRTPGRFHQNAKQICA